MKFLMPLFVFLVAANAMPVGDVPDVPIINDGYSSIAEGGKPAASESVPKIAPELPAKPDIPAPVDPVLADPAPAAVPDVKGGLPDKLPIKEAPVAFDSPSVPEIPSAAPKVPEIPAELVPSVPKSEPAVPDVPSKPVVLEEMKALPVPGPEALPAVPQVPAAPALPEDVKSVPVPETPAEVPKPQIEEKKADLKNSQALDEKSEKITDNMIEDSKASKDQIPEVAVDLLKQKSEVHPDKSIDIVEAAKSPAAVADEESSAPVIKSADIAIPEKKIDLAPIEAKAEEKSDEVTAEKSDEVTAEKSEKSEQMKESEESEEQKEPEKKVPEEPKKEAEPVSNVQPQNLPAGVQEEGMRVIRDTEEEKKSEEPAKPELVKSVEDVKPEAVAPSTTEATSAKLEEKPKPSEASAPESAESSEEKTLEKTSENVDIPQALPQLAGEQKSNESSEEKSSSEEKQSKEEKSNESTEPTKENSKESEEAKP